MGDRILAAMALAGLLPLAAAGCTTQGALADRAIAYNEVAAEAADSQLLLNIVRAAHRNPVHYTAISQLRDSRSVERSWSISGEFPFGEDANLVFPISPSLNASRSIAPSFDIVPLDTKAAAQGLFRPVEAQTFITFWQQDWPQYILLSLFVDTLTMNQAAREACGLGPDFASVDNAAYNEERFAQAQRAFGCLYRKLEVVETPLVNEPIKSSIIAPEVMVKALPGLAEQGFKVTQDGSRYTVKKGGSHWNLVFRYGRHEEKSALVPTDRSVANSSSTKPEIGFVFRSVDGMVFYLGEVVRAQLEGKPAPVVWVENQHSALFRVTVDAPHSGQQIDIRFLGRRFAVSRIPDKDDRTLTTLSMLTQLFALYREGADLPKTSAAQIVGTL